MNECQDPGICQNGGQCTDLERGYSCTCTDRFSGTNCEIPGKEVQKNAIVMLHGGACMLLYNIVYIHPLHDIM